MRTCLVLLAMAGMGSSWAAAAAPLAEVSRVSGLVRVSHGVRGAPAQPTAGMPLVEADRVACLGGKVELRFTDGHLLRLVENASLEIMAPVQGKKKGVFTRLLAGKVRALVAKFSGNEVFVIQSSYAVASVKGTDLLFDGRSATVRDEGDVMEHSVELLSPQGRLLALIGEGETAGHRPDGSIDQPHPADSAVLEEMERQFDVAPPAGGTTSGTTGEGGQGAGTKAAEAAAGAGESGEGESAEDENADLYAEMSDFASSDELVNYYDWMERTSDLQLGKVILDRHGNRVEMEQYNYLLSTNTIEYLVLNFRDGGPSAGLTAMTTDLTFNTDLPADRFDDVRRGLSISFRDTSVYPVYWLTQEYRSIMNQDGEQLTEDVYLSDPVEIWSAPTRAFSGGTWSYGMGGAQVGWGQAFEYARTITENWSYLPLEHYLVTEYGDLNAGWYLGANPVPDYPAGCVNFQGIPNDATPTAWFLNGATTSGNMWWMPPMYLHDPDFNSTGIPEDGVVDGRPALGNAWFGLGVRETAALATDVGTFRTFERTWYGDPASPDTPTLTISSFIVDDNGNEQDPGVYLGSAGSGWEWDSLLGQMNLEVEYEWFDPYVGVTWLADLLVEPNMFRDSSVMQAGPGFGEPGGAPGLGF